MDVLWYHTVVLFILYFPDDIFPLLIFYLCIFFGEVPLKSLSYFTGVIYFLIVKFLKRNLLIHISASESTEQGGERRKGTNGSFPSQSHLTSRMIYIKLQTTW